MYIETILIRSKFFDHNGKCFFCDAWPNDCKCVCLVSDDEPEFGGDYVFKEKENDDWIFRIYYDKEKVKNFFDLKKIIAVPEQISEISYVLGKDKKPITEEIINSILKKGGFCRIEAELNKHTNKFVPKLINNKITICI